MSVVPKTFADGDRWLADAFIDALEMSLEAMTSERPKASCSPAAIESLEPAAPAWQWFEQPLTAGSGTIAWVGISDATRDEIGRKALVAAGIDDATPEDCVSTWKEILGQILSGVAQALGRRLRREVTCASGRESASPPSAPWLAKLSIAFGSESPFEVCFGWSEGLHNVLEPPQEQTPTPVAMASSPKAASQPQSGKKSIPVVENSRTLDLLLEVELPVAISFGRAQLPLKDVLKLNSGSIVELNRSISEPVDIIVNNCVIARGEVVVVEGNYGVRIKQIISKEERLRTLY